MYKFALCVSLMLKRMARSGLINMIAAVQRWARFCGTLSLDELPQLLNILHWGHELPVSPRLEKQVFYGNIRDLYSGVFISAWL